jgi:tetratricopeptide (TPR) repeat protein
MRRRFALCFVISLAMTALSPELRAQSLSEAMDKLTSVADTYPARVTDENREEINVLWKSIETGLLHYRSEQPTPDENIEFLLGELYRLGHNLDVPEAAAKATSHFRAALAINPTNAKTHLHLGRHLTFINEAPEGQKELLLGVALDPRGANDRALFDLAYNFYLQKEFAVAANLAERNLAMHPNDEAMKLIRDSSNKALRGGAAPKTIKVQVP